MTASDQIRLFYSYAHVDETLRAELDKHLSSLRHSGFITQWHDRDISAGVDRVDQTDKHLNRAHIILLLISPDFLASPYCYGIGMKSIKKYEAGEARVIPILLRPVPWRETPFAKLQVLPHNERPVTIWDDRDLAFQDIAMEIHRVVGELQESQINSSSRQEESLQSNDPQVPLRSEANIQTGGTLQQKPVSPDISEFLSCRKKVKELKEIHHMLHEIEWGLSGFLVLIRQRIDPHPDDFSDIKFLWEKLVVSKIDDLVYFAERKMKELEDERFNRDSSEVKGPAWVTDFFNSQRSFEAKLNRRDINGLEDECNKLLRTWSIHLYNINQRLWRAIEELDRSSSLIIGD